jgi:hypothetical protein
MKNLTLALGLFLIFLNASAKDAAVHTAVENCAHAITSSILAMNDLTQAQYCELHAIYNAENDSDEEKWYNVSQSTNLTDFYTAYEAACSTLLANNFVGMSSTDIDDVATQVDIDLEIADIPAPCSGYKSAIQSCIRVDAACVVLAFALWECPPCCALALAGCNALFVDCGINASTNNPGCGPYGGIVWNPYIHPLSSPTGEAGCE